MKFKIILKEAGEMKIPEFYEKSFTKVVEFIEGWKRIADKPPSDAGKYKIFIEDKQVSLGDGVVMIPKNKMTDMGYAYHMALIPLEEPLVELITVRDAVRWEHIREEQKYIKIIFTDDSMLNNNAGMHLNSGYMAVALVHQGKYVPAHSLLVTMMHELGHEVQQMGAKIKGIGIVNSYTYAPPSKRLRRMRKSKLGASGSNLDANIPHEERDVEFQTRLRDAQRIMKDNLIILNKEYNIPSLRDNVVDIDSYNNAFKMFLKRLNWASYLKNNDKMRYNELIGKLYRTWDDLHK